jgi:hypothetical protein
MGTLDLLAGAKIDKLGREIRGQLAILRRRKLILDGRKEAPARNAALDPLLGELNSLRIRLEFQIRKLESEQSLTPPEDQLVPHARAILDDAAEMVALLIWFGAEMPAETEQSQTESDDRTG